MTGGFWHSEGMKRLRLGFTIVELSIVIIVIGILATISVVNYNGAQQRAKDAKMLDKIDKIKDAVTLFVSKNGHFPAGGLGSTTGIGSAKECADGSGGFFAGTNNYACTVFDTLVASGYLPAGLLDDVPKNLLYNYGSPEPNTSIMLYEIPDLSRAVVFIYVDKPSAAADDRFSKLIDECGVPSWIVSTAYQNGMRDAYCFDY